MTYNEALFVLANRGMYDDRTYHYALDIVEWKEGGSRYDR